MKTTNEFLQIHKDITVARIAELSRDWTAALESYQRVATYAPEFSIIYRCLARIARYQSDESRAAKYQEQAFEIDRSYPLENYIECGLHSRLPMISHAKIQHELEQVEYLVSNGIVDSDTLKSYSGHYDLLEIISGPEDRDSLYVLNETVLRSLNEYVYRPLNRYSPKKIPGLTLNSSLNFEELEQAYFSNNEVIVIDGILSDESLTELRRSVLESTIWFDGKPNRYTGAYLNQGLASELIYQIGFDLKRKLPNILGGHLLEEIWGYRYESRGRGIAIHADAAAVNVNLWTTPNSANLDSSNGGLIVYPVMPPLDWPFSKYNNVKFGEEIYSYLHNTQVEPIRIPYRENRVVIFNSQYFHKTDEFNFSEGFENRRTNITFLYGDAPHDPDYWLKKFWKNET